jgi:hypothetical protein
MVLVRVMHPFGMKLLTAARIGLRDQFGKIMLTSRAKVVPNLPGIIRVLRRESKFLEFLLRLDKFRYIGVNGDGHQAHSL